MGFPAQAVAPDGDLIALYLGGEEQAATELVRRHATALARYIAAQGAPPDELEDLTQETLFKAFRALGTFRGGASFRTWLLAIGGNVLKDRRRRWRKNHVVELTPEIRDPSGDPASHAEAGWAAERLRGGDREAGAPAARGVPDASAAGARVRRHREWTGHHGRGGTGPLSPRRQEAQGMDRMNDELPPEIGAALKALDARAARRAARVDVERVAARVLDRLRQGEVERPRRVLWMPPVALRAAAAVVVLAAAGVIASLATHHPEQSASLRLPVAIPAMDSLNAGQLESVLQAAGEVSPVADSQVPALSGRSLDDLTDDQLQTLLASLSDAQG